MPLSFYKWRAKFGGMDVPDAKRLRGLEGENAKLKKLLAEAHLDIHAQRADQRGLASSVHPVDGKDVQRVDETFALPIVVLRCRSPQSAAGSGRASPFHSLKGDTASFKRYHSQSKAK